MQMPVTYVLLIRKLDALLCARFKIILLRFLPFPTRIKVIPKFNVISRCPRYTAGMEKDTAKVIFP